MGQIKSILGKINFLIGRTPIVAKDPNWRKFVKEPYKSVLIISADFELAWAWQFANINDSYQLAINKARQARKNIPKILQLCEQYDIPITWATVGHLFLENCESHNGLPHAEIPRLPHLQNEFWKFDGRDWFQNDPCSSVHKDPEWYAPDLIEKILESPVSHEIGCHTFSHIDCREVVCKKEVFDAEVSKCKELATKKNISLKSFVHPAHTIGHLDDLAAHGFTNYRTNYRNILGYPIKQKNLLWEFEQTAEIDYRQDWSVEYHIQRLKTIVDRSIQSNTVCYLWFHPSMNPIAVDKILPELFKYINSLRELLWVVTSGDYIQFLNENEK